MSQLLEAIERKQVLEFVADNSRRVWEAAMSSKGEGSTAELVLAHEAEHLGDATLVREGEPATLQIVRATMEIGKGDRLLPAEAPTIISYVPHAPEQPIEGRVIEEELEDVALGLLGELLLLLDDEPLDRDDRGGSMLDHVYAPSLDGRPELGRTRSIAY